MGKLPEPLSRVLLASLHLYGILRSMGAQTSMGSGCILGQALTRGTSSGVACMGWTVDGDWGKNPSRGGKLTFLDRALVAILVPANCQEVG